MVRNCHLPLFEKEKGPVTFQNGLVLAVTTRNTVTLTDWYYNQYTVETALLSTKMKYLINPFLFLSISRREVSAAQDSPNIGSCRTVSNSEVSDCGSIKMSWMMRIHVVSTLEGYYHLKVLAS